MKCAVWDLDNTLWDGTLIEQGLERLRLRESVITVIKTLDKRGILNSIASKNSADDALRALRHFGIEEYLLHPQISWGPKSCAIDEISRRINIGRDTIVFIDDQPFERAEVAAAFPEVEVFADNEAPALLSMTRFDVPITDESRRRRSFYRNEISRDVALSSFDGTYEGFLRSCAIELSIHPLSEEQLDRVRRVGAAHQPDELLRQKVLKGRPKVDYVAGRQENIRHVLSRPVRRVWDHRFCRGFNVCTQTG